jgi:hypothetical protein
LEAYLRKEKRGVFKQDHPSDKWVCRKERKRGLLRNYPNTAADIGFGKRFQQWQRPYDIPQSAQLDK